MPSLLALGLGGFLSSSSWLDLTTLNLAEVQLPIIKLLFHNEKFSR